MCLKETTFSTTDRSSFREPKHLPIKYFDDNFRTTLADVNFADLDEIAHRLVEDQKYPEQARKDGWPSPEQTPMIGTVIVFF